MPKQRATDGKEKAYKQRDGYGVTTVKVAIIIASFSFTSFLGSITYVYTSDRQEFKAGIQEIARNSAEIATTQKLLAQKIENDQKITNAYMVNTDKRVDRLEGNFNQFYTRQKRYWTENNL